MSDLPDLLQFFGTSFREVNPTISSKGSGELSDAHMSYNLLELMVSTLQVIANSLLNQDPQQTELFFLEYGVQELVSVMIENTFKLNEVSSLLFCFVQPTNNSHVRVLQKVSDKLGTKNRNMMPYFLARLFLFE